MNNKTLSNPKHWKIGTSFSPRSSITLQQIKHAGFDCIELVISGHMHAPNHQTLEETYAPIIEEARQLNLEIWSIHFPLGDRWDLSTVNEEERQKIVAYHREWLQWVHEQQVKQVTIHPSFEPILPEERNGRLKACQQSLRALAIHGKELDINICVENLPRTCLGNTSEEILKLIQAHEHLSVCLDVNHLFQETPEHFIRKVASHIQTTHMSDFDGVDERHWLPGEGVLHWHKIIQALTEIAYEGPFLYEVSEEHKPEAIMQNWQELLDHYQQNS